MKFALFRAVGLLLAFGLGLLIPALHSYNFLIRVGLIFMLFAVYLRINPAQKMFHPTQLISIGFAICFAGCGWWVLNSLGYTQLAQVVFFTAITPTATAAPVIVGLIGGNINYTVTTFLLSNVLTSMLFPVLIPVVVGSPAMGVISDVLIRVFSVTLLPLVVALIVRAVSSVRAESLGKRLAPYTFYVWIALVVLIAANARHFLDQQAQIPWSLLGTIAALSLFICIVNFVVGHCIGKPAYALECSQALGQKNTSYTVYLALHYANPMVALGPTIYVLWHNLWNAYQLYRYDASAKS